MENTVQQLQFTRFLGKDYNVMLTKWCFKTLFSFKVYKNVCVTYKGSQFREFN